MADLDPLLRLRRYGVEEKQKALADLFREAEALEAKKASFLKQLEEEKKLAEEKDDFGTYSAYILFAARVREEIEDMNEALTLLETRIAKAREEMRDAFADMKRVEIVERARKQDKRNAEERRDGALLDEVGIEGFRRKNEEEEQNPFPPLHEQL